MKPNKLALILALVLTACASHDVPAVTDAATVTDAPPATAAPLEPVTLPETTVAPETTLTPEITTTLETTAAPSHTIEVIDGVTYIDGVLIVNKTYALPADYPQQSLTTEALNAYWTMKQAAAADGLTIKSISDYRSWYDQRYIYNGYVARDGQEAADRYSARPGHSEHQSGLAIDINSTAFDFDATPEGQWLATHCAEYGFVIRYPKDKEEITGYMYEPWHVRYVGVELAKELYLGDGQFTTLEEYFGITSVYAE